jgi:hypothetical protein
VGYTALGYDCRRKDVGWRSALTYKGPYCTTVFFVNRRTGILADFETSSQYYVGPAWRLCRHTERRCRTPASPTLLSGCGQFLGFTTSRVSLTLDFIGGTVRPDRSVVGAHLADITVTSRRHDVGVEASLC